LLIPLTYHYLLHNLQAHWYTCPKLAQV